MFYRELDVLPRDAFVETSAARAAFRVADLLQLRAQLKRHLPKAGKPDYVQARCRRLSELT
jgi:hypothetical protein